PRLRDQQRLALSGDGRTAATAGDGELAVWDLPTGARLRAARGKPRQPGWGARPAALSPGGSRAGVAGGDAGARVRARPADGETVCLVRARLANGEREPQEAIGCPGAGKGAPVFSPDGECWRRATGAVPSASGRRAPAGCAAH